MNQDDPFSAAEPDRTIIMPSPGGRAAPPRAAPSVSNPLSAEQPVLADWAHNPSGLNPLLASANPLLNIVHELRNTLQHDNPSGLRDYLAQNIKAFEARALANGITQDKVIAARYSLCTLLDETAASTPWGGSGIWANHSLLVMFHNEAWGGEKFFQLLAKLAENPAPNRDLLELMYICLTMGLEGRYRVVENGKAQLERIRERLAEIVKLQHGDYERDLAAHWQPAPMKQSHLFTVLPIWVVFAICALALLGVYLGFSFSLNDLSDPAFSKIQSIRVPVAVAAVTPVKPPAPAAKPRLAGFLMDEVNKGWVTVLDDENKSVVTIRGDSLFAPGSADISDQYTSLLMRIADALNGVPGQIQIIGHSDNVPIRSVRFPSNYHLSKARAVSVMQLLAQKVVPVNRMSADGRADSEPIAPNDTAANRAKNRRVEITLFSAQQ